MKKQDPPVTDLPADLIDIKHAARLAKSNLATIHRWVQTNKLRGWKRCGRMFVSESELLGLFKPVNDAPVAKGRVFDWREEHRKAVEKLRARGYTL